MYDPRALGCFSQCMNIQPFAVLEHWLSESTVEVSELYAGLIRLIYIFFLCFIADAQNRQMKRLQLGQHVDVMAL